jgi:hypothetical protein
MTYSTFNNLKILYMGTYLLINITFQVNSNISFADLCFDDKVTFFPAPGSKCWLTFCAS